MICTEFTTDDLRHLPALQPPTWGNLVPRFEYFIRSIYCKPLKIIENEQMVAIGTTMMHKDTAWLACIVTHPEHRKKGLGNLMTVSLINDIDRQKFPTIYLDATEFGFPVYVKLGFTLENVYGHFIKEGSALDNTISGKIIPFSRAYREQVYHVDREVSGEDRRGVLGDFISSSMIYVDQSRVLGYYIPDWGDNPIIAIDDTAGLELMKLRIKDNDSAILPLENTLAIELLEKNGFRQARFSRRMYLGPERPWKQDKIFNRISGQLG
ncbi:GNAT family N-acetyltransferase [Dyadobacter arcticus]|uniref:Ribosomal protein S18 acetylase RimI-like enzyme n=1 Tax=Dyadobacter arcticus TaxID=1078754 RepID=A0ABX0UNF5_9BACT|nr:GNAT family N-acetyltransferase [Dyadobacter arcticus]NIJ53983.1 ribosomal protein S18 acetylase RimI-like enzyme [Dyadobacter arcticus]